jgi:hypothetical protein
MTFADASAAIVPAATPMSAGDMPRRSPSEGRRMSARHAGVDDRLLRIDRADRCNGWLNERGGRH